MKYKTTRYKTLMGVKEVLEFVEDDYGQWIVYQDNKPKFHINCFDYSSESNRLLNDWILSKQRSVDQILNNVNRRNHINLTLKKTPLFVLKAESETTEISLKPLPLEWLN